MSGKQKKASGITLIELMITIAVLAVIMAVAIPNYRTQAVRGNRTEALDELLRQAAFQQRQFTVNNSYTAVANFTTATGLYTIATAVANAGQTYTISAIPQAAQADDTCGTLTLDNTGQRTATGNDAQCWAGRTG